MSTHPARSGSTRRGARPIQRISGPGELVQAVPYLLGFHPRTSLVLVGLAGGELVVTARLDLMDAAHPELLADTIRSMHGGGARQIVAAVYDDSVEPATPATRPWSGVAADLCEQAELAGCDVADVLLVVGGRWWSYTCTDPGCCPPEGVAVPSAPSAFTTAATYAGVVALPDRDALAEVLRPRPAAERQQLAVAIEAAEREGVSATTRTGATSVSTRVRAVKRSVFAAARNADAPRWSGLPDGRVACFAVALREIAVRDAVWLAIDGGRLDGRALWRDMAARVPPPYDAAPLFLFGWCTWRAGDGALAGIAAQQAVDSDPDYSAADLLLAALSGGVDPRRFPKLRLPRTA